MQTAAEHAELVHQNDVGDAGDAGDAGNADLVNSDSGIIIEVNYFFKRQ